MVFVSKWTYEESSILMALMVALLSPSVAEQAKPLVHVVRYQFDLPVTR
jgi:hypothetical protein